jgi:hypothetical protein
MALKFRAVPVNTSRGGRRPLTGRRCAEGQRVGRIGCDGWGSGWAFLQRSVAAPIRLVAPGERPSKRLAPDVRSSCDLNKPQLLNEPQPNCDVVHDGGGA